jgi:hypothetical protein
LAVNAKSVPAKAATIAAQNAASFSAQFPAIARTIPSAHPNSDPRFFLECEALEFYMDRLVDCKGDSKSTDPELFPSTGISIASKPSSGHSIQLLLCNATL